MPARNAVAEIPVGMELQQPIALCERLTRAKPRFTTLLSPPEDTGWLRLSGVFLFIWAADVERPPRNRTNASFRAYQTVATQQTTLAGSYRTFLPALVQVAWILLDWDAQNPNNAMARGLAYSALHAVPDCPVRARLSKTMNRRLGPTRAKPARLTLTQTPAATILRQVEVMGRGTRHVDATLGA